VSYRLRSRSSRPRCAGRSGTRRRQASSKAPARPPALESRARSHATARRIRTLENSAFSFWSPPDIAVAGRAAVTWRRGPSAPLRDRYKDVNGPGKSGTAALTTRARHPPLGRVFAVVGDAGVARAHPAFDEIESGGLAVARGRGR